MEEEKWLKYYKPIELKKGLHAVCEMYESIKNFSLKSLSLMCLCLFESIVYYEINELNTSAFGSEWMLHDTSASIPSGVRIQD